VLLVLGNANANKRGPAKTAVTPGKESLGLSGNLAATDWWAKKSVGMSGDDISITVPGSSWRMIAVETANIE
jgi:hypothetical protein